MLDLESLANAAIASPMPNLNQMERIREMHRLIQRFSQNPANSELKVTDEKLAEELEVSPRQIRRDREVLLRLIDEKDVERGHGGDAPALRFDKKVMSWRYDREVDLSVWVGRLDDEELGALLVAQQALAVFQGMPLARHIKNIFEEDAGGLCGNKRSGLREDITRLLSFHPDGAGKIDEDQFITIFRGLILQQQLAVVYQGKKHEEASERILKPYHLCCYRNQWRLLAHDSKHDEIRCFIVTPRRLKSVRLLNWTFARPQKFDPRELLDQRVDQGITRVTLRVARPGVHHLLERNWTELKAVRELPRGAIEADFAVGNLGEFERLVLSLGKDCEVLSPANVRQRVHAEAGAMTERHK